MSEIIKAEEQEIQQVKDLRDKMVELMIEVGQLQIGKQLLEEELSSITTKAEEYLNQYKVLQAQEDSLVTEMTKKYGAGSFDLDTGEFTPEK